MLVTAIVFVFILTVLVLIHEAGHFIVAKKFGIKVEEFGFGLPPRLWGKKKGETIYSVNWLPIGGFVKLYGEDEAGSGRIEMPKGQEHITKDVHRAFFSRPAWQRALIVVAGVIMNTILAVVIYYVFMFVSGFKTELPLYGEHHFFLVNQQVKTNIVISEVSKGSPAEKVGMKQFSKIISINGETMNDINTFLNVIKENKGKEITLVWEDLTSSERHSGVLVPRENPPKNQGSLGVAFYPMQSVVLNYETPAQKVFSGFIHPANLMGYNFDVLKSLILLSIKEKNPEPVSQGVSGPVGIFNVLSTIINIPDVKERMLQILNLSGILSISLAFFNILPIPGLDGGRFFFILIELVTGRQVNQKFEGYAHAVGMALLIGLILLITYKDILQLFTK